MTCDSWGENDEIGGQSASEDDATTASKSSKGKVIKRQTKQAAKSKAKAGFSKCFLKNCPNKKKPNSRYCGAPTNHHKEVESMKHQAQACGERETLEQVLQDEAKAELAVEQFMKDNPPGQFRKVSFFVHASESI